MNRKDPLELFKKFLKKHDIVFAVRPQKVGYNKDNSIVIEAPAITLMYSDEYEKYSKPPQEQKPQKEKTIELPPEK